MTKRSGSPSAAGLVLAGALLAAGVALLVVAVRGPEPPRTLQERIRAVASELRCPVCEDLSVADSPSAVAQEMLRTIGRDLMAGRTPAQIRDRFVRAYGPWILLSPPRRGIDLVAWAAPAILVLGGVVLALASVRRWTFGARAAGGPRPAGPELSEADRRLLDRALAADPDGE